MTESLPNELRRKGRIAEDKGRSLTALESEYMDLDQKLRAQLGLTLALDDDIQRREEELPVTKANVERLRSLSEEDSVSGALVEDAIQAYQRAGEELAELGVRLEAEIATCEELDSKVQSLEDQLGLERQAHLDAIVSYQTVEQKLESLRSMLRANETMDGGEDPVPTEETDTENGIAGLREHDENVGEPTESPGQSESNSSPPVEDDGGDDDPVEK